MELPWLVGGDFNVVLGEKEKIGGCQSIHQSIKTLPFVSIHVDCLIGV